MKDAQKAADKGYKVKPKYLDEINKALALVLVFILCGAGPTLSWADWSHNNQNNGQNNSQSNAHNNSQNNWHQDGHDYHGHDHNGVDVNFSLWPDTYYDQGPYYPPADSILVSPPVYQPEIIGGQTYYMNDGNYYVYNGYEYQLVSPPVEQVIQAPQIVQPPEADVPDSITINIPNDQGTYTPVTLKKSGSGYIGPQGEMYPEFPTVAQLKVIYGKS